jgi:hypothetical protein
MASKRKPWQQNYCVPGEEYDRDALVADYEEWVRLGYVESSKRDMLDSFRAFPRRIVFGPQDKSGWRKSPPNPRCWRDVFGNCRFAGEL